MDGAGTSAGNWLDESEMAAWLALIHLVYRLPQTLDKQLREEAGISHTYYMMLATLSAEPEHTLSMGELSRRTCTSPPRLSNAISSLERKGWVRRTRSPDDGRIFYALLTDAGLAELERIAPGHVDEVRRRVFDRLTPDQVEQLRSIGETLLGGLPDGQQGPGRATRRPRSGHLRTDR